MEPCVPNLARSLLRKSTMRNEAGHVERFLRTLAVLGSLLTLGVADAQTWPAKPIRVVVPYPAGGAVDVMTRVVTTRLSQDLGQPIVIENRPGANANLGPEAVAKAAPDGYTLLASATYLLTNPLLESALRWQPGDFVPVARFTTSPNFILTPASLQTNSLRDFIAHAKAHPGLPVADAGSGSPQTMAIEMLKIVSALDLQQVLYKGGPPIVPDLINGTMNMAVLPCNVALSSLRSGRIKALASTSDKRSPLFPDVPTVAEEGYPAVTVVSWYGFHVPTGTPREIVQKLAAATGTATQAEEVRARTANVCGEISFLATEAFDGFLREDLARWQRFVQTIRRK